MGFSSQHVIGYARRPTGQTSSSTSLRVLRQGCGACTRRRRSLPVPRRSWTAMDLRFMSGVDRHLPAQRASCPARATRGCDASRSESETTRGARTTRYGEDATRRLQCFRSTRQGLTWLAKQIGPEPRKARFTRSTLSNASERSRSSSNSSARAEPQPFRIGLGRSLIRTFNSIRFHDSATSFQALSPGGARAARKKAQLLPIPRAVADELALRPTFRWRPSAPTWTK